MATATANRAELKTTMYLGDSHKYELTVDAEYGSVDNLRAIRSVLEIAEIFGVPMDSCTSFRLQGDSLVFTWIQTSRMPPYELNDRREERRIHQG